MAGIIHRRSRNYVGAVRGKPHRHYGVFHNYLKPDFCYAPGLHNNRLDLVQRIPGTFTTYSGTVTSKVIPIHGESVNFPGDATTGQRGAELEWNYGTTLQQPNFTVMLVVRLESRGKSNLCGMFGSWEAGATNRSWLITHQNSTKWAFLVYNDTPTYIQLESTEDAVLDKTTVVVVRKSGDNLAIWADGVKTSADSFSGTLQQPGNNAPIKIGDFYWDGSNNYPMDGDVFLAQYWGRALSDSQILDLTDDPYLPIRMYSPFRYTGGSPAASYWGIDHYFKHIAGM